MLIQPLLSASRPSNGAPLKLPRFRIAAGAERCSDAYPGQAFLGWRRIPALTCLQSLLANERSLMQPKLTDDNDRATIAALLRDTIAANRFPLSLSSRNSLGKRGIKIEFYGHSTFRWTILGVTLAAGI
jgi:hypothetical protein